MAQIPLTRPQWPASKAGRVLAALQRIGWRIVPNFRFASDLAARGLAPISFAHHDKEELGPVILSEIAKHTGLRPEDL